ncbi:hypothetical protein, partial [Klebsiella pneumoniae]|uniref:hypothetical protein n=1 Tax=Klebsiella pneumoniae TaxID=573 RepID=UPI0034D1E98D
QKNILYSTFSIITYKQHLVIATNNHIAGIGPRTVNDGFIKKGVYKSLHKNVTPPASNYTTHMYANTNLKRLILIALLILSHS